ncbi:MAG: PEP-CTERM sorting domain-containing protein [Armatimonadetes bacterium]|nr:PEP-CTERM sorting domain-containing protein [Armatimonadota bacterium]
MASANAQTYHVNVIPADPGGAAIWPLSLNNSGLVAGNVGNSPNEKPFTWSIGTGLKTFAQAPNSTETDTRVIGDDGVLYGERKASSGNMGFTIDSNGVYSDFQSYFYPRAVNSAGVVAGMYDSTTAAIYSSSTGMHLLSIPGQGYALDVNDAGVVVGNYFLGDGSHARKWDALGNGTDLEVPQGYSNSNVNAINNAGLSVGYYTDQTGFAHGAYWTPDGTAHLMSGESVGTGFMMDVNDSGVAIGVYSPTQSDNKAVLWTASGGLTRLESILDADSTGWWGFTPTKINNLGQILCTGYAPGSTQAKNILLTPVPEPSSLLAISFSLLAYRRAKRKR